MVTCLAAHLSWRYRTGLLLLFAVSHTCETQHSSDQPGASPVFVLLGTEMDEHYSSSRSAMWSHSDAPSSQRCIVRTCFVEKRSSNTPTTCSLVKFLPHVRSHLALQSARANISGALCSFRSLKTHKPLVPRPRRFGGGVGCLRLDSRPSAWTSSADPAAALRVSWAGASASSEDPLDRDEA